MSDDIENGNGKKRKTGPKRSDFQRERDLTEIANLYLKGRFQHDIAVEISTKYYPDDPLTQQQISQDISKLVKRWRQSQLLDIDDAKTRELARIDNLELTYWDAWERSLEEFKSKVIKAKGTRIEKVKDGEAETETRSTPVEQSQKSEDRNGDPRYLQGVQWCIEQRCKILGVYAAIKQEITGALHFQHVSNELGQSDESLADN